MQTDSIEKTASVQRVVLKDLNLDRIYSLEKAVKDFVLHYKEEASTFLGTWKWIMAILGGGTDQLWCVFEGDEVTAYFIVTPQQELSGAWYLFIHQAWGRSDVPRETKQGYLKTICDEAFKWGCKSIKFLTRRNMEAFTEWLPKAWMPTRTLFELRCDNG